MTDGRARAALRILAGDRSYLALWLGQFISIFGDRFTYLALLAVIVARARDPGNPAAELAFLPLASFLPTILFGPWIGALVDRSDTRRVLIVSDAARGFIVLAMIPATLAGGLPALFVLVFVLYLANTFFLPARSAIVPLLVSSDHLTEANSLATFAGVAATIVGSLVAGLLIDRFGWQWGFAIDAATYFASVYFLWRIRVKPVSAVSGAAAAGVANGTGRASTSERYRRLGADIREGLAWLRRSPSARWVTLTIVFLWTAGGVLHVAIPTLTNTTGRVASGVGSLLAAAAVGMVAGTLGLTFGGRASSRRLRLPTSLAGAGASLLLFALAPTSIASLGAAFLVGLFVVVLLVSAETVLQEAIPAEARGRVFAFRDMAARMAVLVTAGATGWSVARGVSPRTAVIAAAVFLVVMGGIGWLGRNSNGEAGAAKA